MKGNLKIGFDLDKVFINYPPFVPTRTIDWLYRHSLVDIFKKPRIKQLRYKVPKSSLERFIRKLSHYYLLRPPIKSNIEFLKEFSNKHQTIYLISSRYSFLEELTYDLLKRYSIFNIFKKIYLNTEDQQPHLFKDKVIKDLKLDVYIDDDLDLLKYLGQQNPKLKLFWYNPFKEPKDHHSIIMLNNLKSINNYL